MLGAYIGIIVEVTHSLIVELAYYYYMFIAVGPLCRLALRRPPLAPASGRGQGRRRAAAARIGGGAEREGGKGWRGQPPPRHPPIHPLHSLRVGGGSGEGSAAILAPATGLAGRLCRAAPAAVAVALRHAPLIDL